MLRNAWVYMAFYALEDLKVYDNKAYQWRVVGLYREDGQPAHFTVYFRAGGTTRPLEDFFTGDRRIRLCGVYGPRSWLVDYSGPYDNDRPPHVECTLSLQDQQEIRMMEPQYSWNSRHWYGVRTRRD